MLSRCGAFVPGEGRGFFLGQEVEIDVEIFGDRCWRLEDGF